MNVMQTYEFWLANANDEVKQELVKMQGNHALIEDSFFKEIAFGTGGLRGKLGAGTNRMNVYTVGRVTFGLANYILKNTANHTIAIAYDSRNMSTEFAKLTAEIMSSMGIKAYLFSELAPTPVLSYFVRKMNLGAGIVITASHNPKEYNGYKVYNEKGCQITDSVAKQITCEIENCDYFNNYTADQNLIEIVDNEAIDQFLDDISKYSLGYNPQFLPSIVYTPLNGAGKKPVCKLLQKMGINTVHLVEEQAMPDGNFPTCPFPNPEEKEALSLAIKLAKEKGSELIIATDPDADRVGIGVREEKGDYRLLNGNETGVLMLNFILSVKAKRNEIAPNAYAVKTIVTTPLAEKIAKDFNVDIKNVLTGFKYIGEAIDSTNGTFLFGMEESYGYLVGTHARDKDAVSAVMTIIEAVCYYKENGLTLMQALDSLYKKYGYYQSALYSKTFEGKSGMEFMKNFIDSLRANPWNNICGAEVKKVIDYSKGINGLPPSDVLVFECDDVTLIVRPSGTEPKIKLYLTASAQTEQAARQKCAQLVEFASKSL